MSSHKCPIPSELKEKLIKKAKKKFEELDEEKIPFKLSRKNLEKNRIIKRKTERI